MSMRKNVFSDTIKKLPSFAIFDPINPVRQLSLGASPSVVTSKHYCIALLVPRKAK